MADITLLELRPDGNIQLGPTSLRGSQSGGPDPVTETETESDTESVAVDTEGGRSLGRLLLVAGFVALVVVMASKLLGEDADEELADLD